MVVGKEEKKKKKRKTQASPFETRCGWTEASEITRDRKRNRSPNKHCCYVVKIGGDWKCVSVRVSLATQYARFLRVFAYAYRRHVSSIREERKVASDVSEGPDRLETRRTGIFALGAA